MDLMFLEIDAISAQGYEESSFNYEYEKNINNIRNRYGLKLFIDDKSAGLDNLFDANIASALEIKIENEMEIPMMENSQTMAVDEREYFVEEALEDEGSIDDTLKDDSDESVSYEEVEQESADEEFEEKLKTKKKERKAFGDNEELFE